MARRDTTLTRDPSDQKIAGVCSGLARYFDVDTTLVRVLFVAFALMGGWTIVAYLLLWWLLDEESVVPVSADDWEAPVSPPAEPAAGDDVA